jgi:hypothetical protein
MESVEEYQTALEGLSSDAMVALICAAAERFLPVYDAVGSGDPALLRGVIDDLWGWLGGSPWDTTLDERYQELEEYADADYADGDEVLGGISAAVLASIDAARRHSQAGPTRDAVAQGLLAALDLADAIDAALEDADVEPGAVEGDQAWLHHAIATARAEPVQELRALLTAQVPAWVEHYLQASLDD